MKRTTEPEDVANVISLLLLQKQTLLIAQLYTVMGNLDREQYKAKLITPAFKAIFSSIMILNHGNLY